MTGENHTSSRQYAKNEVQAEQRIIAMAVEQSPQRAVKLLRESLKKDVSYETVNLLKKIHQKDAETANQLAEEVGQKLLDTKLNEDNQDTGFIQYF
jgi:predicted transcriptional regulator